MEGNEYAAGRRATNAGPGGSKVAWQKSVLLCDASHTWIRLAHTVALWISSWAEGCAALALVLLGAGTGGFPAQRSLAGRTAPLLCMPKTSSTAGSAVGHAVPLNPVEGELRSRDCSELAGTGECPLHTYEGPDPFTEVLPSPAPQGAKSTLASR